MINTCEAFHRTEEELVRSASVSSSSYDQLRKLSPGAFELMRGAVEVLEKNGSSDIVAHDYVPTEQERIAAIRLMLVKLRLHTADPAWSSEVLDRIVDAVMRTPQGAIGDLFLAVFDIFADYPAELTPIRANFIRDVVINCFTRYRHAYDAVDWRSFANKFGDGVTKSQLYLGQLAIPPDHLPEKLALIIKSGLRSTPYHDAALGCEEDQLAFSKRIP